MMSIGRQGCSSRATPASRGGMIAAVTRISAGVGAAGVCENASRPLISFHEWNDKTIKGLTYFLLKSCSARIYFWINYDDGQLLYNQIKRYIEE
jgi:hypothetical protein